MMNEQIKANQLVEELGIKKGENANTYVKFLKDQGIRTNDNSNLIRKVAQIHFIRYGECTLWDKVAIKYGLNSKQEVEDMYFNQLVEMLRN